jgi:hypothetical protein
MESQPCRQKIGVRGRLTRVPAVYAVCETPSEAGGASTSSSFRGIGCVWHRPFGRRDHRAEAQCHDASLCAAKKKPRKPFFGFPGPFKCRTLLIRYVPGKPSVGVMPTLRVANAMDMTQCERTHDCVLRFAILSLRHDIAFGLQGHIRYTRIGAACCSECEVVYRKRHENSMLVSVFACLKRFASENLNPKFSICEPFGNPR